MITGYLKIKPDVMLKTKAADLLRDSGDGTLDVGHRDTIAQNIEQYKVAFEQGKQKFFNLDNSRKKAHLIQWRSLENLERYLNEFESNFTNRGGKVIWANDIAEAQEEIGRILAQHHVKMVVRSNSSITEEVAIDELLQKNNIESIETDLSTFIVHQLGEKPYHSTTPTAHLRLADITKVFHEKFDTPSDASAAQLVQKVRELLRDRYTSADASITGADFLVADVGGISLSDNEGNSRLSTAFPKIQIAIAGIEKIIPSLSDIDLLWPLSASHETGQHLAVYNSLITSPRQHGENDGPEEMYVVLLDNGRTELLAHREQRERLYCIQCGACLHSCPIYQNIEDRTDNRTYQGPLEALIKPHLNQEALTALAHASPSCGKSSELCPVDIDLHKVMLINRRDAVQQDRVSPSDKRLWTNFSRLMKGRRRLDFFSASIKNFLLRWFFKKSWGTNRELPTVAKKSFAQQWKEQQKEAE